MVRPRRPLVAGLGAALIGLVPVATARPAVAEPALVPGVIALDGEPGTITAGPDGNMWATLSSSSGDDLVRVTPGGDVTYYDVPGVTALGTLTRRGGSLWATHTDGVVEIPPAAPLTATVHDLMGFTDAQGIDTGPDGNLWAASGDRVFRIPPADPVGGAESFQVAGLAARQVSTSGNRVWVADFGGRALAFAPDGTHVEHVVDGNLQGIVGGTRGQVLYTNPGSDPQSAGRLSLGGAPRVTPLPGTDPSFSAALGRDGAYYVGLFLTREVARITATGQKREFGTFPAPYSPRHVAAGPGGTIWVSLQDPGNEGAIGRLRGVASADTGVNVRVARRAVVTGRAAAVRVACPRSERSGPCRGRVVLRGLTGRSKQLGARSWSARAGRTDVVRVGVPRSLARRVARRGPVRVLARVTVRDRAGNRRTVRVRIWLVPR